MEEKKQNPSERFMLNRFVLHRVLLKTLVRCLHVVETRQDTTSLEKSIKTIRNKTYHKIQKIEQNPCDTKNNVRGNVCFIVWTSFSETKEKRVSSNDIFRIFYKFEMLL